MEWTLKPTLEFLHAELGLPTQISIGNTTFGDIISDLASADNTIQTAIIFTGKVRNTLGHNLEWIININQEKHNQLFKMIGFSCLHAIAC